jgi:tetratricopeptide (TPR) repeat protein
LNLGGADLDGNNALVANVWEQSLLVRGEANSILESLDQVEDSGVRAGLEAYAAIFKALANGTLAQFFEQAPLIVQDNAPFVTREQVLQEAIEALQSAQQTLNATAVSPTFLSRTPGSIDLTNTVNALLARYSLFAGNYQQAIDAATEVDLTATSTFSYDAVNTNPIAFVSILTNNVYQPVDLMLGLPEALQPDTTDQRLEFYFADTSPEENDFRAAAFFDDPTDAIPVYLPGEMLLIQAEAHARLGNLDEAVAALNQVLTKTPDEDPFGIGAGASPYDGPETQEAILEAIYQNRAVELFMSGLGLEDSRRFERPGPNAANPERNRNWYPYPNSERDNNENTPANPSI